MINLLFYYITISYIALILINIYRYTINEFKFNVSEFILLIFSPIVLPLLIVLTISSYFEDE